MNKHLQYLRYVVKHKFCTLVECYKLGILWRGIIHDLSKFSPSEWSPYVEWFYGGETRYTVTKYKREEIIDGDTIVASSEKVWLDDRDGRYCYTIRLLPLAAKQAFDMALNHHHKHNKHHWPYWVLTRYDSNDNVSLEMPNEYLREMLADWRGASRAQGMNSTTDVAEWYMKRRERFKKVIHPKSRIWLELHLGVAIE